MSHLMDDQVLHLLVTGLLGPMPGATPAGPSGPAPATLERWLARGDHRPVPADPDALLFYLYGMPLPLPGEGVTPDLPTAALCYLADTGQRPEGVVFHADPVFLRPDQDRLVLFDAPANDLDSDEAAELITAINDHLEADGWRLSAPTPGRWYLHLARQPFLQTRPLGMVLGRNIDRFLPEGADAREFRQRLTEVQMLLHGQQANARREAAGKLPVNGLWLHGGGALPIPPAKGFALHGAPSPLLRGLQQLANGPAAGQLHWLGAAQRAVWDADPGRWWQAVQLTEQQLQQAPASAILYPGDGQAYRYGPAQRWRLWRRRRPLSDYLLPQDSY